MDLIWRYHSYLESLVFVISLDFEDVICSFWLNLLTLYFSEVAAQRITELTLITYKHDLKCIKSFIHDPQRLLSFFWILVFNGSESVLWYTWILLVS